MARSRPFVLNGSHYSGYGAGPFSCEGLRQAVRLALSHPARRLVLMPPEPASRGSARSAADANEAICKLLRRAFGRPLTDEERAEYQLLVTQWAAAVRKETDIVEAA